MDWRIYELYSALQLYIAKIELGCIVYNLFERVTCGLLSDWRVTLQPPLERRCPPSPSSSSWTARVHPNQHPGELHAIPSHISSMLQAQNHWCNQAVCYFHSSVTKLISTGVTYSFLTVSCITWIRIFQGMVCQLSMG